MWKLRSSKFDFEVVRRAWNKNQAMEAFYRFERDGTDKTLFQNQFLELMLSLVSHTNPQIEEQGSSWAVKYYVWKLQCTASERQNALTEVEGIVQARATNI